jgi:D-alanyl-D-alanine carboxypeptidase
MIKNSLFFAVALLAVGAAFTAGAGAFALVSRPQLASVAAATPRLELDPGALEARAAMLYDPSTGDIWYQKNAQEALPLASLTKLMSAYAVLSAEDTGTVVTIQAEDLAPDGDWGFRVGDKVTVDNLLKIGLVASSNDAMAAAARSLSSGYLAAMNETAVGLNLTKTYFLNPTGLDLNDDTSGAYGSAFDVARLIAAFYKKYPGYLQLTERPSISIPDGNRTLTSAATAIPLQDIPGFVGAKTGYTDLAGGNLAAVFDLSIGRPIVAVVLGSSESGRFADIRTLIETARAERL